MKKIFLIIFGVINVIVMLPVTVYADLGPKPSVVIDFSGLSEETYYATLISKSASSGPYSASIDDNDSRCDESEVDYNIHLKFLEYQDSDGYYFLHFFKNCTQTQQLNWPSRAPDEFKILLYLPETDTFIVSEIHRRYAFDSYFTADVELDTSDIKQGEAKITTKKTYDYIGEIVSLLVRILLTILIELGIAWLFGFTEKRQFRFIALVNIITQIALNLLLNIFAYNSGWGFGSYFVYFILEVAVFIAEAVVYSAHLKKHSSNSIPFWKPSVYALVANVSSYFLGFILVYWIPNIF